MERVKDKVVIVTGGALGIGKETCILLAKEGAKVAVTDILDEKAEQLVNEIGQTGGVAKFWHLNVADEKAVEKVISEVVSEFGKLDAIVNNAGIAGVNKPTDELTEAEWDQVMDINVKGVFFCTKHAIPHLRKNGQGSIVNLSSIYGLVGAGDVPHYHASKGAVRLMSKNDALIYAKDKIRVNSVHPGFIWTPMVEEFGKDVPDFSEVLKGLHPLGHAGEPADIGYGILYLISDESKFVTGSELVIDGGYTAR